MLLLLTLTMIGTQLIQPCEGHALMGMSHNQSVTGRCYWDSGCSQHMWDDPSHFTWVKPYSGAIKTAAKGKQIEIVGKGDVPLLDVQNTSGSWVKVTLHNVLLVPNLTCKLMSDISLVEDGV